MKKEIIELYDLEVNRLEQKQMQCTPMADLNEEQKNALQYLNTTDNKVNLCMA
ncbi:MAG: hypothetical protein CM15mP23_19450 [Cryomorphaceae bacterium]|nr:MAG: hypothetical protein CM15mP23_19450 [Cryomorphaceae bacterium]